MPRSQRAHGRSRDAASSAGWLSIWCEAWNEVSVGSTDDVVIGGWPLSVAAAALAAMATLSRQALVLNSVDPSRLRCTCCGAGLFLGARCVLASLSIGAPCFSAALGRGWICCKWASDTCLRARSRAMLCSLRQPVGRCLESSRSSSTTSSSLGAPVSRCPTLASARECGTWPRAHVLTLLALLRTFRCLGCGDGSNPGDGSSGAAKAAAKAASGKAALYDCSQRQGGSG